MLPTCGTQVAAFCNCSGLNGLPAVRWKPAAAATSSAAGSQRSSAAPCRAAHGRARDSATPLRAKPAITMEITQ